MFYETEIEDILREIHEVLEEYSRNEISHIEAMDRIGKHILQLVDVQNRYVKIATGGSKS